MQTWALDKAKLYKVHTTRYKEWRTDTELTEVLLQQIAAMASDGR